MANERDLAGWVREELRLRLGVVPEHPAPAPTYHANALIDAARAATRSTSRFRLLRAIASSR